MSVEFSSDRDGGVENGDNTEAGVDESPGQIDSLLPPDISTNAQDFSEPG